MSALPEFAQVVSIRDEYEQLLGKVEEADAAIHVLRDGIQAKLVALTLAEDTGFTGALSEMQKKIEAGDVPVAENLGERLDKWG